MAILYFKGGAYFDGGIKSVAEEINAATLFQLQLNFWRHSPCQSVIKYLDQPQSTPARTSRQAKSQKIV